MNTDQFWKWIVIKDGQYLKAAVYGVPRWSNNRSDAAQIDLFSDAVRVAEKVSGEVRRLNILTHEVR